MSPESIKKEKQSKTKHEWRCYYGIQYPKIVTALVILLTIAKKNKTNMVRDDDIISPIRRIGLKTTAVRSRELVP